MTTKHTPAYAAASPDQAYAIAEANKTLRAVGLATYSTCRRERDELLAALRELEARYPNNVGMVAARAAIAKAEGR